MTNLSLLVCFLSIATVKYVTAAATKDVGCTPINYNAGTSGATCAPNPCQAGKACPSPVVPGTTGTLSDQVDITCVAPSEWGGTVTTKVAYKTGTSGAGTATQATANKVTLYCGLDTGKKRWYAEAALTTRIVTNDGADTDTAPTDVFCDTTCAPAACLTAPTAANAMCPTTTTTSTTTTTAAVVSTAGAAATSGAAAATTGPAAATGGGPTTGAPVAPATTGSACSWSEWMVGSCNDSCGMCGYITMTRTCNGPSSCQSSCSGSDTMSGSSKCPDTPCLFPKPNCCPPAVRMSIGGRFVCRISGTNGTGPTPGPGPVTPAPCSQIWSAWTSASCNDTCGMCGQLLRNRTCQSTSSCPCTGPSQESVGPCPGNVCQFPREACCAGYTRTPVNGIYQCTSSGRKKRYNAATWLDSIMGYLYAK